MRILRIFIANLSKISSFPILTFEMAKWSLWGNLFTWVALFVVFGCYCSGVGGGNLHKSVLHCRFTRACVCVCVCVCVYVCVRVCVWKFSGEMTCSGEMSETVKFSSEMSVVEMCWNLTAKWVKWCNILARWVKWWNLVAKWDKFRIEMRVVEIWWNLAAKWVKWWRLVAKEWNDDV